MFVKIEKNYGLFEYNMIKSLLSACRLKCLILVLIVPAFAEGAVISAKGDSISIRKVAKDKTESHGISKFNILSCSHAGVAADYKKPLQITFSQAVDATTLKNIIISDGGAEGEPRGADNKKLSGKWILSKDFRTATFRESKKFRPGMFVSITIPETVKNSQGEAFVEGKDAISFMMDNDVNYGQRIIKIDTLKLVDNNLIPLVISVPDNSKKHPVILFVHGGGWTGGTATLSSASLPGGYTASYLSDKLGVAVVGVGYRCMGSNGSFAKAKADIEDAVKFVKEHAEEFNFDLDRIGICGESAGAPLAALIAQQDKDIKYYIGWNGIYDFVNDSDGKFGQGNGYGQEEPSAEANSALYYIRNAPPATLLLHGTKDHAISYRQSVAFSKAVQDAGGYSKLLLYEGQPHWYFYAPGGKYEISALYQVKDFLIKRMNLKVN